MAKLTGQARDVWRKIAARGGKARAKKYSAAKLSEWGRAGGTSSKRITAILACLDEGPHTSKDLAKKLHKTTREIASSLSYLSRKRKGRQPRVKKSNKWPPLWSKVESSEPSKEERAA